MKPPSKLVQHYMETSHAWRVSLIGGFGDKTANREVLLEMPWEPHLVYYVSYAEVLGREAKYLRMDMDYGFMSETNIEPGSGALMISGIHIDWIPDGMVIDLSRYIYRSSEPKAPTS